LLDKQTKGIKKMNHKETTSKVRKFIFDSGIRATVRMQTICGDRIIQVNTIKYGIEFTKKEQRIIRQMAINFGFTWVRGLEINAKQNTNPYDFNFYL